MKKAILAAIMGSVVSASAFAGNGLTDFSNPKPYIGLDYTYLTDVQGALKSSLGSELTDLVVENYTHQAAFVAGVQVNDYVGIEATIGKNLKDISKFDGIDLDVLTATLAVTGQYPIYDRYYLKGAVGQAWNRFEMEALGQSAHESYDKFYAKAGFGYQWSANSVSELTYVYNGGMDGISAQYKFVF